MDQIINKTIDLDLTTIPGNAFSLMGHFKKQAQREGWTPEEITAVLDECMTGNYDHLVATISDHCNPK